MSSAMKKIEEVLERKFVPIASKVGSNRHIGAIRDGVILTMPLIIVGSLFLCLGFIPIPGYDAFMAKIFGDAWLTKLLYPVNVTFGLVGMITSLGVAYRLSEKYKLDPLAGSVLSLASFMLVTPFKITTENGDVAGIPLALMGSVGMFVAILVAIFSTEVYRIVIQKGITIKMPDSVPPAVAKSFTALIPFLATISTFWVLRIVVENTSIGSVHNIVSTILGKPLGMLGGSLFGALASVLILHLLWVVGVHGASIVYAVMTPVWMQLMDQNRAAFQAGQALPNVITQQFFDIFIYVGGAGGTLAFVVLMVTMAKSRQLKEVGKLSLIPGLFNINEPVIFGVPIVMNPIIMIPFITAPLVSTVITYFAMNSGLVARPAGIAVPWTSPIFVGGFLASGGAMSAVILQLITFAVSLAIYFPFFKIYDKQKVAEEGEEIKLQAQTV